MNKKEKDSNGLYCKESNGLHWIESLAMTYDALGLSFNNTVKIREDCFDRTQSLFKIKKIKYKKISKNSFSVKDLGYSFVFIKETQNNKNL